MAVINLLSDRFLKSNQLVQDRVVKYLARISTYCPNAYSELAWFYKKKDKPNSMISPRSYYNPRLTDDEANALHDSIEQSSSPDVARQFYDLLRNLYNHCAFILKPYTGDMFIKDMRFLKRTYSEKDWCIYRDDAYTAMLARQDIIIDPKYFVVQAGHHVDYGTLAELYNNGLSGPLHGLIKFNLLELKRYYAQLDANTPFKLAHCKRMGKTASKNPLIDDITLLKDLWLFLRGGLWTKIICSNESETVSKSLN